MLALEVIRHLLVPHVLQEALHELLARVDRLPLLVELGPGRSILALIPIRIAAM
jgi:hypothetical protein